MIDVIARIYEVLCLNHGYCADLCPFRSYCVDRCRLSGYCVDICPLSRYCVDCPCSSSVTTTRTDCAGS